MSRKSGGRGKHTSDVEVTNVSKQGFWLLIDGQERFLAFDVFPWFRSATIDQLLHVQLAGPGHLHWPSLDLDIAVESIDHPEEYPLLSRLPAAPPNVKK